MLVGGCRYEGLDGVDDEGGELNGVVLVAVVGGKGAVDGAVAGGPREGVEDSLVVAVFEWLDLEVSVFEHVGQQCVRVENLVIEGGRVRVTVSADLHDLLVFGVPEVAVRYGASHVSSGLQVLVAEFRGFTSFCFGEVFPDVLAKEGVDALVCE